MRLRIHCRRHRSRSIAPALAERLVVAAQLRIIATDGLLAESDYLARRDRALRAMTLDELVATLP